MDILATARRLEAALSERLDRAAGRIRQAGPREPLEIVHAVVDGVMRHVQPGGRGRYVFPYNRLKVTLVAATKDARAKLDAVFDGEPSLRDRLVERLASADCRTSDLEVRTAFVAAAATDWQDPDFHLELHRLPERTATVVRPEEPMAAIALTIEHGKAAQETYEFTAAPVYLGRCADVRDSRHRLIRANHVAFLDAGVEANATVSRQHAHITHDAATGQLRVCDDRSAHGTGILRDGRIINVPAGSRGIRIQSGDVIVLGEARIRFTTTSGT